MTRINCIPVSLIIDNQLLGEYKEMPRMTSYLRKSMNTGRPLDIPLFYKMSTGHVKFFYNKGEYLRLRYIEIYNELKRRGFNPQNKEFNMAPFRHYGMMGNWTPTADAMRVNAERIAERIMGMDDNDVRYYGNKISKEQVIELLKEYL